MGFHFERKPRSAHEEALLEKAGRYLPAGVRNTAADPALAMLVAGGHGCWLRDASGNEYIDYLMGSGPLLLGHAPEPVVSAVQKALSGGSSHLVLS